MIDNYDLIVQNQAQRSYGPCKDWPKAEPLNAANVVTRPSVPECLLSTIRVLWLVALTASRTGSPRDGALWRGRTHSLTLGFILGRRTPTQWDRRESQSEVGKEGIPNPHSTKEVSRK